jgi:hypothetical protein
MAEVGGVSRSSQAYFEAGTHVPGGAYLIAVASAGVDVQYVLTGTRSGGNRCADSKEGARSPDERAALELYRGLSEADRARAKEMLVTLASAKMKRDKTA